MTSVFYEEKDNFEHIILFHVFMVYFDLISVIQTSSRDLFICVHLFGMLILSVINILSDLDKYFMHKVMDTWYMQFDMTYHHVNNLL